MHAFNLACKSQLAIALSHASSWYVICCCLISSMAVFTFSIWLHATEINVVTRDVKPQIMPSANSDVKQCKYKLIFTTYITFKIKHLSNSSGILSAYSNDYRYINIQIYVTNLTPITFLFRLWIIRSHPSESTLHFDVTE
jgi:tRNA splicing ligase